MVKIKYTHKNNTRLLENPIILTGVPRSGTSLSGSILGSLKDVEYDFEPWLLHQLPVIQSKNLIELSIAGDLLKSNLTDLFFNHIFCRNINLRPTDMSCKTNFISTEQIKERWENIKERFHVENFIKKNKMLFATKMIGLQPFLSFLYSVFKNLKIIHVVRYPFDVALSLQKKNWFSNEALNNNFYVSFLKKIKYKSVFCYIPWWVPDYDFEVFLNFSTYERSLMCWNTLMDAFLKEKQKGILNKTNYLEIKYEDLLSNSNETIESICQFVGKEKTKHTELLIKKINKNNLNKNSAYFLDTLNKKEIEKTLNLMNNFGYTMI